MSKNFTRVLGAGLLTLAVVGGAAAYLTDSLEAKQVKFAYDGITVEHAVQPVHPTKVVTTTEAGRAS